MLRRSSVQIQPLHWQRCPVMWRRLSLWPQDFGRTPMFLAYVGGLEDDGDFMLEVHFEANGNWRRYDDDDADDVVKRWMLDKNQKFFHNVQMQRMSGGCLCPEGKEVRFVGQAISSEPMVWIWRHCKTSETEPGICQETWKLCLLERPHPWKFTAGTQKMKGLRRWFSFFKEVIFRFHVMSPAFVSPFVFLVVGRPVPPISQCLGRWT